MKSSKEIISHIINLPSYKELKNHSECDQLIQMLGQNFSRLIKFAYVKNNTLFFILLHPAGMQELKRDSSINRIRSILKTYLNFNKNSILANVVEFKFFITNQPISRQIEPLQSKILFVEPSFGEFKNLAKNEKIYEKFEKIRKIIKSNLAKNGESFADR